MKDEEDPDWEDNRYIWKGSVRIRNINEGLNTKVSWKIWRSKTVNDGTNHISVVSFLGHNLFSYLTHYCQTEAEKDLVSKDPHTRCSISKKKNGIMFCYGPYTFRNT